MEITVVEHGNEIVVVSPQGTLDSHTVPELRTCIDQLIDGGTTRVVLDLQEVPFLDSAGLAVLVATQRRAREAGGGVVLTWPRDEAVQRILRLTRFDRVFQISPTVDEAIANV
jgi:anti-anti-sigma factor